MLSDWINECKRSLSFTNAQTFDHLFPAPAVGFAGVGLAVLTIHFPVVHTPTYGSKFSFEIGGAPESPWRTHRDTGRCCTLQHDRLLTVKANHLTTVLLLPKHTLSLTSSINSKEETSHIHTQHTHIHLQNLGLIVGSLCCSEGFFPFPLALPAINRVSVCVRRTFIWPILSLAASPACRFCHLHLH